MQINVLDLGSNSFHLLCARVLEDQRVDRIAERKRTVRLGDRAFRTGSIGEVDWQAGMHAIADLLTVAHGCSIPVVAVATSVFRDSDNGAACLSDIRRRFGVEVEVLSEAGEAELSLRGALHGLSGDGRPSRHRAAVVDIGGGSIELAVGDRNECLMTRSVPLGVLRLAATCISTDKVLHRSGAMEIERLMYERLADDAYAVKRLMPSQVVFASGTARLIAKLTSASRLRSGVWRVSRAAVAELVAKLENQTPAQLIARGIPSDRADTIAVGAVAFGTLLDLLGADTAVVTSTGLREGVAARAADRMRGHAHSSVYEHTASR